MLKCTKFNFGWGCAPAPAQGAYRGRKGAEGKDRERSGRGEKGTGRERHGRSPWLF